jgi:hypothetical protein
MSIQSLKGSHICLLAFICPVQLINSFHVAIASGPPSDKRMEKLDLSKSVCQSRGDVPKCNCFLWSREGLFANFCGKQ